MTIGRDRLLALARAVLVAAALAPGVAAAAAPTIGWRVVAEYPHDPQAFTQGLVLAGGVLYESTGQYGESSLRKVRLASGHVVRMRRLAPDVFGEGLAIVGDTLVQLTWRSGRGFVYRMADFGVVREFPIPAREGWGLAYDGHRLVMSDGTDVLRFLDPRRLTVIGSVTVRDGARPVERLNELEWLGGSVLANVWQTTRIARIDPASGTVTGWLELAPLVARAGGARIGVLNGIAYDATAGRVLVTGKYWPRVFALELDAR